MLSSQSVDDAWMRLGTHRFLQARLHTRDASCALRNASFTITRDAHAPSVRNKSSRNEGYVRLTARHPPTNHSAGIITSGTKTAALNCGVTCINCRMAYLEEKTRWLYKNTSSCHFLSRINNMKTKRNIQAYALKACRQSKGRMGALNHNTNKT
ncbi:hypothetical protein TcCL_ESM11028 [Trypanosoma cruzi]|nr:hypothetical protein TcCL_ESM11028 [Trypanosoma cruzi]